MPTNPVVQSPSLQSYTIEQLTAQLTKLLAEHGASINSLAKGLFGALHLASEDIVYTVGSPRRLDISEGVSIVFVNTGGGAYTLQGMNLPEFDGRVVHILNNNLFGGIVTLNHSDGVLNVEQRFWCFNSVNQILNPGSSAVFVWAKNPSLYANGIWRQIR